MGREQWNQPYPDSGGLPPTMQLHRIVGSTGMSRFILQYCSAGFHFNHPYMMELRHKQPHVPTSRYAFVFPLGVPYIHLQDILIIY